VDPPGWVPDRGTAVGLRLKNPLSPLLDAGYVEAALRRHFEPLLDAAFDDVLRDAYPEGVALALNGRLLERRHVTGDDRARLEARLPRKRKPSAVGWLFRSEQPLPEHEQGLAVSTRGKVIRRGWDWLGLTPSSPACVAGLVEAPALAASLTLHKSDVLRSGRRGIAYLAYRKAIQEAVSAQLAAWGEARDAEDGARRRAARPLERDLESVLVDLAEDFPVLAALVEHRAGGQRRLPTGIPAPAPVARTEAAQLDAKLLQETEAPSEPPGDRPATTLPGPSGPRRPARYGLTVEFEDRDSPEVARLVESTVYVNTSHPAYVRAVASRSEGYHAALGVGMALAAVAVESSKAQEFLTAFLARWGEALTRDGRRRKPGNGRAAR
jgi:hypothetical protein